MKRLMPFALATVLFILFISFNYKPLPGAHRDLNKKDTVLQPLIAVSTIVDINLDRPAVITEIRCSAKGSLAAIDASDIPVPVIFFEKVKPGSKLPFELPSSMEAVRNQKEDFTSNSNDPLYKFGFGLSYKKISLTKFAR
ncbi:MAG TPA: hypothetical protein VFH08_10150 [Chitinophagaceae bacterium]|nr:hypothetical protein [Chitinophagaceae bacterium]